MSPRSGTSCGASGSLRTQQRAWITSPFVHVSGCTQLYFLERSRSRPTGQCSTLELHLGMNIRAWVWATRTNPAPGAP